MDGLTATHPEPSLRLSPSQIAEVTHSTELGPVAAPDAKIKSRGMSHRRIQWNKHSGFAQRSDLVSLPEAINGFASQFLR
jgi:hypothetical protein